MTTSLDSDRPILANGQKPARPPSTITQASTTAPSLTPSQYSREAGIIEITDGLNRLEQAKLQQQRFVVSEKKGEVINKLALGAKLDRALRWRMSGQDAVMRQKKVQQ